MKETSRTSITCSCILAVLIIFRSQLSVAQDSPTAHLILISPVSGEMAMGKMPTIMFRTSQPLLAEGSFILLDGDDITALVSLEQGVFSYTPITALGAGEHSLYMAAYSEEGLPVEMELFFSSRHSESFEEIYSDNSISSTYKTIVKKRVTSSIETVDDSVDDSRIDSPYTSFDNYIYSESRVKEGKWESSVAANVRYYEQNAGLLEPEKKGFSLIDFLITSDYSGDKSTVRMELGDTSIEESQNTIDYLTRRGAKVSISSGRLTFNSFTVLGDESGYEIDGLGLGFNSNDHIMGSSAKLDFFDQQMSLKAIYIRGGAENNSLGTSSGTGKEKGDVTGIVLETDFFEQFFTTSFEFDAANYEQEADDESTVYDKAYLIKIGGLKEEYDYQLSYNYTGPEYQVVGNQSLIKDWAGFDFSAGMTSEKHSVRVLTNYFWDNVEDDTLYARLYSLTSGLDYQYSGWAKFPMSLTYEYNMQESTDEPLETDATSQVTSTLSGGIGYIDGPWSIDFRSSFSDQNDKTDNNYDSELYSFSLTPSYTGDKFSILSSWSLNSSTDPTSGAKTEIHTVTLDLYLNLFKDIVSCELAGTYDQTTSEDDSIDTNNATVSSRLNYRIGKLWWLEDSTIALEHRYTRQEDEVSDTDSSENIVTLVISTVIPYSY